MGEGLMYDPSQPNAKMTDYEERRFDGVLVDELFYVSNDKKDTNSYRKLDEQTAMNIRSREVLEFDQKLVVYVKN
tara:strand:- start:116 stop:340 length:225 start_codon:yes stop_codon:yes gene_type:complete